LKKRLNKRDSNACLPISQFALMILFWYFYTIDSWKLHYMIETVSPAHSDYFVDSVYISEGQCHGDDLSVKFHFHGTENRCVSIRFHTFIDRGYVTKIKSKETCDQDERDYDHGWSRHEFFNATGLKPSTFYELPERKRLCYSKSSDRSNALNVPLTLDDDKMIFRSSEFGSYPKIQYITSGLSQYRPCLTPSY